ncbi:MAG: 3'-5' exonuclease [Actinomycetota bacterium]
MTSADLSELRFAVVDVETTGLSSEHDSVLQVGVVVVDSAGTVLDRWGSLLRPRQRWFGRVGAQHIHGIRRRQLRHAPPAPQVLARLLESLDGCILVAHNAEFDIAFLRKACQRAAIEFPPRPTLCTLELARGLDPNRTMSHRLAALCERYGIDLLSPHDALADADATAALLPVLLREHGIASAGQLEAQLSSR